jgi:hypothetical protein
MPPPKLRSRMQAEILYGRHFEPAIKVDEALGDAATDV